MIGWVDASAGASGDMLLGALVGAGVPVDALSSAVSAVAPEPVQLTVQRVIRNGFAATRCAVDFGDSQRHRSWQEVRTLLAAAPITPGVRLRATATFKRLAEAEAAVHAATPESVHFHEVGALDAIADIVGVCAGLEYLQLEGLVVSPVAVGSGWVSGAHGSLPVPPPAVAELLRDAPSHAGPAAMETCTPTGAALLRSNATSFSAQPAMAVRQIGVGAGKADTDSHANVLRLFLGDSVSTRDSGNFVVEHGTDRPHMLQANIDDLDPRLWPNVIEALLRAGAADAWLTPILMKKGRPAHTLSVLVDAPRLPRVRAMIFEQTSTIGLREIPVTKTALERDTFAVQIGEFTVRLKMAFLDGQVVNSQPEYEDVVVVARSMDLPVKDVLTKIQEAAALLVGKPREEQASVRIDTFLHRTGQQGAADPPTPAD